MSVLFFFFLLLGTSFWDGVTLPLGLPFVGVRVGFFAPFYCIGAPLLAGEHAVQREGKDVSVSLRCAGRGILESRQAKCGLLRDIGRGGLGNCRCRIHRRRVLSSCRGDVSSKTGARDHLCRSADNQPCLSLIGLSTWGCAETATDDLVSGGRCHSMTRWPLLSAGLRPLPKG